MPRNFGNDWITRSHQRGEPPMPHTYGGFGEHHNDKPVKTIIGVAILVVLSVVLYEIKGNRSDAQSSAAPAVTHNVASSQH